MGIDLDSLYELYMGYMGFTVSRVFTQDKTILTEIQSIATVELKKNDFSKNIEFSPHINAENHPVDDTRFITLWNNLIGYKIDSVIILETLTRSRPVNKMLKVAFKASDGTKVIEFNEDGNIALKR